jgi:signal transduction protein with GAF and PtsI domain
MFALAGILADPELVKVLKTFFAEGAGPDASDSRAFAASRDNFKILVDTSPNAQADLDELAERVIRQLGGVLESVELPSEKFILITESLSPMVASKLDPGCLPRGYYRHGQCHVARNHHAQVGKRSGGRRCLRRNQRR